MTDLVPQHTTCVRASQPVGGPSVDPVGVVRFPEGYSGQPRTFSRLTRGISIMLLLTFLATVVVTTAVSLGQYCLTTHGGDQRALNAHLQADP